MEGSVAPLAYFRCRGVWVPAFAGTTADQLPLNEL